MVDFGAITLLLLMAGIPLLLTGSALWDQTPPLIPIIAIVGAVVAFLWCQRHQSSTFPSQTDKQKSSLSFYRIIATAFLLLLFAILTFYIPMQKAFWNSTDEGEMLYITNTTPLPTLMARGERFESRPLEILGVELAQQFSPNSIDGFLWLGFMLRCASALLVYGIVQSLLSSKRIALLAGLLFMVSPAEPWRYVVIVMMDYYLSLFLFLLGCWLYLISYRAEKRWLLLCACLALVCSLLVRESALLLALAWAFILFLSRPKRKWLWLWLYTWLGTCLLMAARFGLFWFGNANSYQHDLTAHLSSLSDIAGNVVSQLKLSLSYVQGLNHLPTYWQYSLVVLIIAIGLLWLSRSARGLHDLRCYLLGLPLAGLGIILAIVPYFAFTEPNRTQFFAVPAQAIGWALIIGLVSSFGPGWLRGFVLIAVSGFLITASIAGSLAYQDSQVKFTASFSNIAHIFEQVHTLAPTIEPHTLVLFVISDGRSYFGGRNYQLIVLSRLALGVDAYQANFVDVFGQQPIFTSAGITLAPDPSEPPNRVEFYGYGHIIAFWVDSDAKVTLLDRLPQSLLSEGVSAQDYNPYVHIQQGNPAPLRFLRLSP